MRTKYILALTLTSLAFASPANSPPAYFQNLADNFSISAGFAANYAYSAEQQGLVEAAMYFRGYADAYAQAAQRLWVLINEQRPQQP